MARILVQLKLRLLRNGLRASTAAKVSFVVSTVFACLLAAGTFAALASFRGQAISVNLTTVIFTLFAFGWLIAPIFAFGLDGTLDPATLAPYPLRTRPLATGLLAASATGAWPLANVLGLLGVMVGLASGALGELVAVVAVLLQVLFCITLARFVTTSMARLLRSRRGRDFAAFLIVPVVALYEIFTQLVPRAAAQGTLTTRSFAGFDAWIRWLPPGLAAHAIQDASDGNPGTAVLRLALLAAVIAALGWLWIRSLSRALVTADTSTQSSRVHSSALPFARSGLRGAVAARYWIYQRREPTSLVYWGMTAVIMAAASVAAFTGQGHNPNVLLFGAVLGAAFVGVFHGNAVGLTGPAFIFEATALAGRRELRSYFTGQNLALAVIAVPLLIAIGFGLAIADRRPEYGFLSMALALAGLGAALAMSNIFSVVLPYPMARRAGNPLPQAAQGYTAYGLGCVFGTLLAVGVAVAPLIVAIVLTGSTPALGRDLVLVPCAVIYGLLLAWLGVRIAARVGEPKVPELVQVAVQTKL